MEALHTVQRAIARSPLFFAVDGTEKHDVLSVRAAHNSLSDICVFVPHTLQVQISGFLAGAAASGKCELVKPIHITRQEGLQGKLVDTAGGFCKPFCQRALSLGILKKL